MIYSYDTSMIYHLNLNFISDISPRKSVGEIKKIWEHSVWLQSFKNNVDIKAHIICSLKVFIGLIWEMFEFITEISEKNLRKVSIKSHWGFWETFEQVKICQLWYGVKWVILLFFARSQDLVQIWAISRRIRSPSDVSRLYRTASAPIKALCSSFWCTLPHILTYSSRLI